MKAILVKRVLSCMKGQFNIEDTLSQTYSFREQSTHREEGRMSATGKVSGFGK